MPDVEQLQALVARLTADQLALGSGDEAVRNAVVAVENPAAGLRAEAAAGTLRGDGPAPMRVTSQFHIASVVKPMTAVLIFQAAEAGLLGREGIDARLIDTGVLPPDIVRRLHRIAGRSWGEAITLRHLLTHTSGLRDGQIDDGDATSDYLGAAAPHSLVGRRAPDLKRHLEALAAGHVPAETLRTRKLWRPWDPARPDDPDAGLINFYLSAHTAAANALFRPGEGWHYSDTAFTILALLAEHLLGASYHRLLRERIFDPLGMNDSYLDGHGDLDPTPWMRDLSDCWAGPTPMVTANISLSNDWGGGGVVSTAADLNRFMIGLLGGRLFQRAGTLAEMFRWTRPPGLAPRFAAVGHGVFSFVTTSGITLVGHSGVWGTKMLADPDRGYFYAGTINRRGAKQEWMIEIAEAVARL